METAFKLHSLATNEDISDFCAGNHTHAYKFLGAHLMSLNNEFGCQFAVWAPNAKRVAVIGSFNNWKPAYHWLYPRQDGSGIWEGFLAGVKQADLYKYRIYGPNQVILEKADPYATFAEVPPATASMVWRSSYTWNDAQWLKNRHQIQALDKPLSIYEVHAGSWKRKSDEKNRSYSYRELALELVPYAQKMGFTHLELMPVMHFPYLPSWGYQITGYYAPSSRFGTPDDLRFLIDTAHQAGLGVLLDWVPSHYPEDSHGLAFFDGTHLYEHADPRQGFHPDWKSCIFNYGRFEVKSFLLSNAAYWLREFHADGLRVDAVASMLYLDYSRKDGEWIPNKFGGRENLEAISFLQSLNDFIHREMPDVLTMAEESTAYPLVTRPPSAGGLGFNHKWMMGWMHDTLDYYKADPLFRKPNQHKITFSLTYAFSENFILPFSHDEVVHGKGTLLTRMPGSYTDKMANLRLLYGYMFTHPGAKLLFMGCEFGQIAEWNFTSQLDWGLINATAHAAIQNLVCNLNHLYCKEPALHELNYHPNGFEWIAYDDADNSVIAFLRHSKNKKESMLIVCHHTPLTRFGYELGVPAATFVPVLNTESSCFGGSGIENKPQIKATAKPKHGRSHSISLTLPPFSTQIFRIKHATVAKKDKSNAATAKVIKERKNKQ